MTAEKNKGLKELTKNPWLTWGIVFVLLIIILVSSSSIRLSNLPLLVDQTTGDSIPLALDPFYFLRVAETINANGGTLPEIDTFRYYPEGEVEWTKEILPRAVYLTYNIYKVFSPEVTLAYVHNISTVIFFIIGLILFFFLTLLLTKSKWLALLASTFLAYSPAYLYRTMAGFSDHEAIGMASFFLALLICGFSAKYVGRKKFELYKTVLFSIVLSFATALTIASWGGVANFLFIIIPISFFFIWVFNSKKKNIFFQKSILIYYFSWIIFTHLFGYFLFGYSLSSIFIYFTKSQGLLSIAVFGFIIIDFLLIYFKPKFIKEKMRVLYTIGVSAVLGLIGLFALGRNPLYTIWDIVNSLIRPFGVDRIGLTVAENQAPFLTDWIAQTGPVLFWLFFFGVLIFGYQLSKKFKNIQSTFMFLLLYILMIFGVIFSKYSPSSILNGTNFLSVIAYFLPLIAFWIFFFKSYIKEDFKWTRLESVIFAIIFFTIISGRAASRVFFAITPFVCLMAAFLTINLFKESMKTKDKTLKLIFIIFFCVAILASAYSLNYSYTSVKAVSSQTAPSANIQWQKAMQWVRENTTEDSTFVHWWDYGYWIETLGERRTVADGGHFEVVYGGDHKIGRYILTTPKPETALSFFKSMNVDYLLIDQTDLGKYSAYSKIGSDDDWDRFGMIGLGLYDPKNVQETANDTILIYNVQSPVDEDTYYDSNGDGNAEIFMPGPTYDSIGVPSYKYYLIGVVLNKTKDSIKQPIAVYVNTDGSNRQYRIPLRYVYLNGELHDFNSGLDAVVSIIPRVETSYIDPIGAMVYLSPKVSKSLFAELYLLDDAFEKYPTITLAHKEADPIVSQLQSQGYAVGDMIYFGGFRGPIKIWNTEDIPEDINVVDGFYYEHGEGKYALLDEEQFTK